ncbi:hypothetical protein HK100_006947, partial [Physocladia obscura]
TTSNTFFPSPDPEYGTQYYLLYAVGGIVVVSCIGTTIAVYTATYKRLSQNLRSAMACSFEQRLRMRIQSQILRTMILMSSGIILCYMPLALTTAIRGIFRLEKAPDWWSVIVKECAMLDTVITPVMVLYFIPKIRLSVGNQWTWFRFLKLGVESELIDDIED